MKKLVLFKSSKEKIIIICYICVFFMVSYILTLFTNFGFGNEFSLMSFMMFFLMLVQYQTLKKCFFHFDKKSIVWRLPSMNKTERININESQFEIEKDWRGIILKNGDNKIEISCDGLSREDINYIYESLKEYFS